MRFTTYNPLSLVSTHRTADVFVLTYRLLIHEPGGVATLWQIQKHICQIIFSYYVLPSLHPLVSPSSIIPAGRHLVV